MKQQETHLKQQVRLCVLTLCLRSPRRDQSLGREIGPPFWDHLDCYVTLPSLYSLWTRQAPVVVTRWLGELEGPRSWLAALAALEEAVMGTVVFNYTNCT